MPARVDLRRALVISPTPIAPLLGGASARIKTLLGALEAIGFETHLAFIERDPGDKPTMRAMLGERFHPIPYRPQPSETSLAVRLRRRLQQAVGLDAGWLWGIDDIYDPGVEAPLAQLQARFAFDVVIAEYIFFSRALSVFGPDVRKLIDMHDVFGNRHRMYVAAGHDPRWMSVRPADEIRALRRADHVLAIQPDEARLMRERGIDEVDAVSHLVTLAAGPGAVPTAPTVMFVGAANESNAHGLQWFVTRVWPLVLARCPDARFHVAGAVAAGCPVAPGVRIEGRVSSERLEALYGAARVAVNPVFTGSGQSIKVLEATGYGVPVVASAVGLRGIVGASEPGIHLADDPASFARALVRLLNDDDHAARARESAYSFARASNAEQLELLRHACSGAPAPAIAMPEPAAATLEPVIAMNEPVIAMNEPIIERIAPVAAATGTGAGPATASALASEAEAGEAVDEPRIIELPRHVAR